MKLIDLSTGVHFRIGIMPISKTFLKRGCLLLKFEISPSGSGEK